MRIAKRKKPDEPQRFSQHNGDQSSSSTSPSLQRDLYPTIYRSLETQRGPALWVKAACNRNAQARIYKKACLRPSDEDHLEVLLRRVRKKNARDCASRPLTRPLNTRFMSLVHSRTLKACVEDRLIAIQRRVSIRQVMVLVPQRSSARR